MTLRARPTVMAAGLTALAILVPCGGWYLAGSRAAEREARARLAGPQREAALEAERLASRLSARLEALREIESSRSWAHYQHLLSDTIATCDCGELALSPLAEGPADPLILAHFQVDSSGCLTVPTVEGYVEGTWIEGWPDEQGDVLQNLQDAATELWYETLETEGTEAVPASLGGGDREEVPERALVQSPFRWRTLELGGVGSLVALREVTTSRRRLLQGFALSPGQVARGLEGARFPARLTPGDAANGIGESEADGSPPPAAASAVAVAPLALQDAAWHVAVDPSSATSAAEKDAAVVRSDFRRTFLGVTLVALLAGLAVVGVVWQTERLGHQRARFAAAAAHELRTPLAGLRLHGEMLSEGLGDPGRTREYARRMAGEAERLGRVVGNVLGYTRLERGILAIQAKPGDLGEAVRECVHQLGPAVESQGARVQADVADGLPTVSFDSDALVQILENLVDNAEKYSRGANDRTIRVGVRARDREVELTVTDRGPGVPASLGDRLYRPFVRGNGSDAPAGLGLGLVLVQALARAHGGRLGHRPASGGGTVFSVTFPV